MAANGTEALEKFRSGLHSLVITDVRMPGRDGFQLMRELRGCGAPTAVILLTAYGCVPDAVEAMLLLQRTATAIGYDDEAGDYTLDQLGRPRRRRAGDECARKFSALR